jgi:ATP-dependent exoDNAse (exonuclease V) beta subunit
MDIKMKKQRKLRYYQKSHTYRVGKKKLTSVTQFIGQFFSKFDAKEIARKLAKFPFNRKAGRGVRYWLNEWKKSSEYGTLVHKEIENFIKGTHIELPDKRTAQAINWLAHCGMLPVDTEFILYDEDLGLAGTIDCIMEDPVTGELTLVDWKTNKEIKKKSFDGKMGKQPINHLEDHSFNRYSLQLSMYRYLLEKKGFKVKNCLLIHLKEESIVKYEVPYLNKELELMLTSKRENEN